LFFGISNQQVSADSYTNLSFDGIWRSTPEGLYPQMLLNPFEELNLPPTFVKHSYR